MKWKLLASQVTSIILKFKILMFCDQVTYSNFLKAYVKFYLKNH